MSHPIEYNGQQLTAWKSSLHGHTTVSDGWQTPQEIIDRYVQGKYDVVNFSDHRKTNPVSSYDSKGLTLISGIELHPMGPRNILWHLLAVNVPEDFPGIYETAEDAVKAVNAVGGIVYIAHPYWCGLDVEELKPIAGMDGVVGCEICNTSCNIIGKDDSSVIIDALLDQEYKMNIIAVDDGHTPREYCRNWTMIIAEDNSREKLFAALKAGQAYASQGPEFYKISYQDGIFEAEFSPCTEAILIGERGFGKNIAPELDIYGDETITSLKFDCKSIPWQKYFRCRIRDTKGRFAWSNPFYLN